MAGNDKTISQHTNSYDGGKPIGIYGGVDNSNAQTFTVTLADDASQQISDAAPSTTSIWAVEYGSVCDLILVLTSGASLRIGGAGTTQFESVAPASLADTNYTIGYDASSDLVIKSTIDATTTFRVTRLT